ncbi:MAG TPA: hypothetical protein VJU18_00630 [Vicinamibacteria bacterium]|nr:hypothetical protein [Vicinamibacteria bacterium]
MRPLPRLAALALLVPALSQRLTQAAEDQAKAGPASAISVDLLKNLEFRNIGPAIMGGRVDDFAVWEADPSVFYVGTASGGIFRTENAGTTFEPVFDDQEVSSIGDLAIAPSDPSILYVGTGEPNNRQSSSWGNGVYKTLDAGKTWTHLGLKDTHHIGRILVHPQNPSVVYVAALGHLWGPNPERGVFKTTDGGKTWVNTKFVDQDTGFVDLAMDPLSPDTLYAAAYQRRRTQFGYNGGGPGSGLWKTIDGGGTWKKLGKGLPDGELGRIGLAVYRKDPRTLYATVEHSKESGLYRSDDKGESWRKVSDTNPRPSYYSKLHVDPTNDQRVWVLGAQMFYSEDGGKTFKSDLVQKIHGDYHGLWIDPANSNHMLAGTDGGIHVSWDRGRSWDFINTVPLAQFYEVSADLGKPYTVCGGLQDNQAWCGPSRTPYRQGIANEDWFNLGGGDGFFAVLDPSDPTTVYVESQDGNLRRFDRRTNEQRIIRPEPPPGERYRFNWNSPVLLSPHDPKTVYYGGNRLFGSRDRGETWTLVTADLTSGAERDQMPIFGKTAKEFFSRNDGVVHFGTITTVAESPRKAGVLWVGTDDGNVQVSRDGGANWTNVTAKIPGVPKGTYVSRLEASRSGEGAAYLAMDGHRGNDFAVYLFRTEDFGQTWKRITKDLPAGGTVSVVREHPRNADLLLVGTEYGLWVSWNRGDRWHKVKSKLPTVPVDDILVHPRDNDLILGTHGRGVWILDDMGPLDQLTEPVGATDLHLFDMRPATQYRIYSHRGNTGHKAFLAPNPPEGALISYLLKTKPGEKDEVKLVVKDAEGTLVRELKGLKEAGINRTNWDLRHEAPITPEPGAPQAFFGPPRGPWVPPGNYTVTVSVGSWSATKPVVVEEDPRIVVSDGDRKTWYQAVRAGAKLWAQADAANKAAGSLKKQLSEQQEALGKNPKVAEPVKTAVKALLEKVEPLAKRLSRQDPQGFAGAPLAEDPEPLLGRARGLYFGIGSITAPPTPQHRDLLDRVTREVGEVVQSLNGLIDTEVPALNRLMLDHGIGKIDAGKKIP